MTPFLIWYAGAAMYVAGIIIAAICVAANKMTRDCGTGK